MLRRPLEPRDSDLGIFTDVAGRSLDSFTPTNLQPYQGAMPGVDYSIGPRDAVYGLTGVTNSGRAPITPIAEPRTPMAVSLAQNRAQVENDARSQTVSVAAPVKTSQVYTPDNIFSGGSQGFSTGQGLAGKSQVDPLILFAALGFGALIILRK